MSNLSKKGASEASTLPVKDFTKWMNEAFCGKNIAAFIFQRCYPLLLADGTKLSIQAGETHYCEPRQNSVNGDYNEYEEFEIGFPSSVIEEIMEYCEDSDDPTSTVYAYVPKDTIRQLIAARGGVVGFVKPKDK